MTEKTQILLVEDDTHLGFLLVDFLESNGFDVKLCIDGALGLAAFETEKFDFCVLDVMLPKLDGFELAKAIKELDEDMPILMLTARSVDEDKIRGFNIGVDDYVTKPFNEVELVCRIRAILCRVNKVTTIVPSKESVYSIGSYSFVHKDRALACKSEQRRLTRTETDILLVLCRSKNSIVSRKEIMEQVWGEDDYFVGRSLDVFISKIRKYLMHDPTVNIETIPKLGLVLNAS
ncbi:MAG: DNA-binding response OmpR family regulator [Crocinitomix sp.]|jgi:DNA-binding response OmpR family regulator